MFNNIKNHVWVIPHIEKSIQKMRKSDRPIIRSHSNHMDVKECGALFSEAKNADQTLIFCFTPNLEENCIKQLRAYQAAFPHPNFVIYNVNRFNKNEQAGQEGYLAKFRLDNLFMLSDANGFFHKNFKFPYVKLEHNIHPSIWFLPRTTVVVKPDNHSHVFMLPFLLSNEFLQQHVKEMQEFIEQKPHKHLGFHLL